MQRFENLIGGSRSPASSNRWLPSLDPYRNENWCEIPDSDETDVNRAVEAAHAGGKSPNIGFADADLDAAAAGVASGIFAAAGQTCMAGSRLLVQRAVYEKLLAKVVQLAGDIKMGDPMDPDTQMGPLANLPHFHIVIGMIES